jgi:galactokinase/mevalonate kinase-like predicted kinase
MTSQRSLIVIWLVLIALTALAMLAGHVGSGQRLGAGGTGFLLLLSFFKAKLVLRHYLELPAGSGWHGMLLGTTGLLLAVLFGLTLIA